MKNFDGPVTLVTEAECPTFFTTAFTPSRRRAMKGRGRIACVEYAWKLSSSPSRLDLSTAGIKYNSMHDLRQPEAQPAHASTGLHHPCFRAHFATEHLESHSILGRLEALDGSSFDVIHCLQAPILLLRRCYAPLNLRQVAYLDMRAFDTRSSCEGFRCTGEETGAETGIPKHLDLRSRGQTIR